MEPAGQVREREEGAAREREREKQQLRKDEDGDEEDSLIQQIINEIDMITGDISIGSRIGTETAGRQRGHLWMLQRIRVEFRPSCTSRAVL
jgi:hypothetical protein